jgi:hypothetical protein
MFGCAMLTDLKPHEFWKLTIREWFIYSECFYKKRKEQSDYDLSLAWYNAYFQRVNKMPRLKEILSTEPEAETEVDMFEKAKRLNAIFGGEVK